MAKRNVTVELDMPDDAVLCEIDFPGHVYGNGPRLSFMGANGEARLCREPTEAELIAIQAKIPVSAVYFNAADEQRYCRELAVRHHVIRVTEEIRLWVRGDDSQALLHVDTHVKTLAETFLQERARARLEGGPSRPALMDDGIQRSDREQVMLYWVERGILRTEVPAEKAISDQYIKTGAINGGQNAADRLASAFARYRRASVASAYRALEEDVERYEAAVIATGPKE